MEIILSIWNWLIMHVFIPTWNGILDLWNSVLVPFGTAFIAWVQAHIPICTSFADFCTSFFTFKYQARIYTFMLLLPLAVITLFISGIFKRRRRRNYVRKIRK